MFEETADLYDAFYDGLEKDYESEARKVMRLVRRHKRRPRTLLDVACGTGRHLEVFARTLECVGVDVDAAMLAVAGRRCGANVELVRANMTTLDLGRRFDVVTCLFSSIAYNRTVAALRTTVKRLAAHLAPDGVLVVEPWFAPDEWHDGHLGVLVADAAADDAQRAVRVSRSSRRGALSILDFDYLIADQQRTRHVHERHELRLFEWQQYLDAFARAGLQVDVDEYGLFGRGLILGVRAA